jgi:transposase
MELLCSDTIRQFILPFLTEGTRGFKTTYNTESLVRIILYRLKTGCQWREIPLKEFFGDIEICWQTVYHHWNAWSKDGCWQAIWQNFLKHYRFFLDLSTVQTDGSHTPVKRGGFAVAYQGRKSAKTTNALFLVDNRGTPLVMGEPQAGNHHDVFDIDTIFSAMIDELAVSQISLKGVFLNADPGFHAEIVETICAKYDIFPNIKPRKNSKPSEEPYENGTFIFDTDLYKHRSVVEHTNAWIDAFKALLVRFETSIQNWKSLHYLAFLVIFQRKIANDKTKK